MPWIKSGINKGIPSVTRQSIPQIPRTVRLLSKDSIIVDVGAGGRKITKDTICIDSLNFLNIDIISDIHRLSLKNNSIDCVFCTGVFEHIVSPDIALKELWRILKPNGIVHIEVPFLQPYHKDPEDYWRWTLDGLRLFTSKQGFREIRSGALIGSVSAMNVLIIASFQSLFRNRYVRKGIDLLLSYVLFPFKFFDAVLPNRDISVLSAVYYVGRKQK